MSMDESGSMSGLQPKTNGEVPSSDRTESKTPVRNCNQFDVWLQRLSHISQFGLFAVTAWTIYYTVIPLYQKAILDEAIARKEIELKEANAELEKAYGRIKFSVLKDFVFSAGARCSGLKYKEKKYEMELGRKSLSLFAELFELDVPACLKAAAEEYTPLRALKPQDRKLFDESLRVLSQELVRIRQLAKLEYDEVPKRAAINLSALPLPKEDRSETLKVIAKFVSPEVYKQYVLEFTIAEEQSRIAGSYGETIRQKVLTLIPKT